MTSSPTASMRLRGLITQAHTWFKQQISAIGGAIGSLIKSDSAIAYSAVFTISGTFSFPVQFSVFDYPGLLFCHILRASPDAKLVTYWSDEQHYKVYSDSLDHYLGLAPASLIGPALELRPRTPWWKRLSLGKAIIGLAAIVGAFTVIQNSLVEWVSSPRVAVSSSEAGRLDVVEGGPISVPLTVMSKVRFAPIEVTFASPILRSRSTAVQQTLTVDDASLPPNLTPGQSVQVKIYGTAPQLKKDLTSPETYDLIVQATAKAGILRSARLTSPLKRQIRVWAADARKSITKVMTLGGNTCEFDGTLYLSRQYPQGLRAEFTVVGSPGDITDMNVSASGVGDTRAIADTSRTTTKVEFPTPSFEKFQEYRYRVYLELSKPATAPGCTDWSNRIDVRFTDVH